MQETAKNIKAQGTEIIQLIEEIHRKRWDKEEFLDFLEEKLEELSALAENVYDFGDEVDSEWGDAEDEIEDLKDQVEDLEEEELEIANQEIQEWEAIGDERKEDDRRISFLEERVADLEMQLKDAIVVKD